MPAFYVKRFKGQGPVSRKSRKPFGSEKPFVKLRPAYSVKLVISYIVKGMKIKMTAKFRASRRLRLEDTKRIMSPEMCLKSFGTFEKRAAGGIVFAMYECTAWNHTIQEFVFLSFETADF